MNETKTTGQVEMDKLVELDLRQMPPFERHEKIFELWAKIKPGQTLKIINDHDPKPLHYQFEGEFKGNYEWEYVDKGPKDWSVKIKKTGNVKSSDELKRKIEEALESVRPGLQMDGGDVELVGIDDVEKVVTVHLVGACSGCPSAGLTLKAGIEETIREAVPEIREVVAV